MRQLESSESAAPLITKMVAGALSGRSSTTFDFSPLEKIALSVLNLGPPIWSRTAAGKYFGAIALDPAIASDIQTDLLVQNRIADYNHLQGSFPVVVAGAALGGAAAHIATLLGGPFLPQPFILGFSGGSPDDDVHTYLRSARALSKPILAQNPELAAIGHFDPIHDGWLTRSVTHIRLKLTQLPKGYADFIKSRLQAGGALIYLDCSAGWLQYQIGPRLRVQIGGWGDISAREYLSGSERINTFLEKSGSRHRGGWSIDSMETNEHPESEWGTLGGLGGSLKAFAADEGFRFIRVSFPHPHDFSRLAYRMHLHLYEMAGICPKGVLVETFTQYDPYRALAGTLLPLWLIFNSQDSLRFLRKMSADFPKELPVYFSNLVTLSRTPDMATYDDWAHAFEGFKWKNIGASEERYPEDLVSLWKWSERLDGHLGPLPGDRFDPYPLEDFLRHKAQIDSHTGF